MQVSMTQNELFTAFFNPNQPCPEHLKSGKHIPATNGLNIYRNNIAHGLTTLWKATSQKQESFLARRIFIHWRAYTPVKKNQAPPFCINMARGFRNFYKRYLPFLNWDTYLIWPGSSSRSDYLIMRATAPHIIGKTFLSATMQIF